MFLLSASFRCSTHKQPHCTTKHLSVLAACAGRSTRRKGFQQTLRPSHPVRVARRSFEGMGSWLKRLWQALGFYEKNLALRLSGRAGRTGQRQGRGRAGAGQGRGRAGQGRLGPRAGGLCGAVLGPFCEFLVCGEESGRLPLGPAQDGNRLDACIVGVLGFRVRGWRNGVQL